MSLAGLAMATAVKAPAQRVEYTLNEDLLREILLSPLTGPDQLDELVSGANQRQWREFLSQQAVLSEKWHAVQSGNVPEKRGYQIVKVDESTVRFDLVVSLEDLYSRMFRAGLEGKRYYQYLDNRAVEPWSVYKLFIFMPLGRTAVFPPLRVPQPVLSLQERQDAITLAIDHLDRNQAVRLIQEEQELLAQVDPTEWLIGAARHGMTEVFRLLLIHYPPAECPSGETTPLMAIYPQLYLGILEGLVEGRYNDQNMELFRLIDQRTVGCELEHWLSIRGYLAAFQGLPDMIPDRMERLGDVNAMIVGLIENGHTESLETFLKALDVTTLTIDELTPAIKQGYTDMVELILLMTEPLSPTDLIPLFNMAASEGRYGIVELLLEQGGVTSLTDPLLAALHHGWKDIARLLLDRPTVLDLYRFE